MRRFLPAFIALMRQSVATMLQYRGELLLWALWGVVYPMVAMVMWSAAVKGSGGTDIRGLGPRDFAAYFLLTMIVGHAATAWDIYEMGFLVRTGLMSAKLLRPIQPVWERLADNLAYKIVTLAVLIPIWSAIVWWTEPAFATTSTHLLLGVPALALAAVIYFVWSYTLGILAFWITRMDAIGELWFAATLFFGGRLAPLTIMPGPLQVMAWCLPFKWAIWFPSKALTGRLEPQEILAGIGWQVFWLAAGVAALRLMWRTGVKRYAAVGS